MLREVGGETRKSGGAPARERLAAAEGGEWGNRRGEVREEQEDTGVDRRMPVGEMCLINDRTN